MKVKNKVTTLGYFLKRLRDSGFIVIKVFSDYGQHDPRKWSVIVDPSYSSILITCYQNKDFKGDYFFEINDGGNLFPKNYNLKTSSIEVIVTTLLERGVSQKSDDASYIKA